MTNALHRHSRGEEGIIGHSQLSLAGEDVVCRSDIFWSLEKRSGKPPSRVAELLVEDIAEDVVVYRRDDVASSEGCEITTSQDYHVASSQAEPTDSTQSESMAS